MRIQTRGTHAAAGQRQGREHSASDGQSLDSTRVSCAEHGGKLLLDGLGVTSRRCVEVEKGLREGRSRDIAWRAALLPVTCIAFAPPKVYALGSVPPYPARQPGPAHVKEVLIAKY
jgi:hypothetical protein